MSLNVKNCKFFFKLKKLHISSFSGQHSWEYYFALLGPKGSLATLPNKVLGSLGKVIFPPIVIPSLWPPCNEEINSYSYIL